MLAHFEAAEKYLAFEARCLGADHPDAAASANNQVEHLISIFSREHPTSMEAAPLLERLGAKSKVFSAEQLKSLATTISKMVRQTTLIYRPSAWRTARQCNVLQLSDR